MPARVLVVGGTGAFGERLVRGILETTELDVVIAGRGEARLAALVARCNSATSLVLDARRATPDALSATGAFAVVDAAGPYQGGDYGLARAAIAAGLHHLDLADARDFVAGFGAALDAEARAAGVVALTGVSSTPALSNAALDRLTAGWSRVDRAEVAISPGNRAPRGLSVVRSILSYAGGPVRVFADGRWRERPGWGMTVRREMPGLGRRWLALVETPDLDIMPERFAVQHSAVFRAGLELPALHLGLLLASLPVRAGLVRSLAPMARPFRALASVLEPFGTDRGGMLVEAEGLDGEGQPIRGRWSLVAEGGDGPHVPTLPALAALRALAEGRLACRPGASACVGVLPLEAIEAEFRPYRITSRIGWERPPPSLYERVLGDAFHGLPEPLRVLHRPGWGTTHARGEARVDGAEGAVARLVAAAFRLPRAAERAPVSVAITPGPHGRERWARDFGGRRFASVLSASATPGRVVERFGPFSFELDLQVGPEGVLGMPVRAWRIGPFPLPPALAPVSVATEGVDEWGRFRFDVEMRLPLGRRNRQGDFRLGRLVRYRGWLAPDSPPGADAGATIPGPMLWTRGRDRRDRASGDAARRCPAMHEPETYRFADDGRRFPNSPLPLLVHRAALPPDAASMERAFEANGWSNSWRDGVFGYHHFHSTAHEVLGVAKGEVRVAFGGPSGQEVTVRAGDAVVIPAGVAHRNAGQSADLLVVGAYPGGSGYDIRRGEPSEYGAAKRAIAAVPAPDSDPVLGRDGGLRRLWAGGGAQP